MNPRRRDVYRRGSTSTPAAPSNQQKKSPYNLWIPEYLPIVTVRCRSASMTKYRYRYTKDGIKKRGNSLLDLDYMLSILYV
ncbi:predicted protein [Plenodomus lingam JN3]|uniref:Predicted protein n=1 Tax=Leptosphaeria maculans (strain JN3 / isolate v23.1.3 / race Av1-4-5-6-7-8) TaxID=985895 RepID=E5A2S9_LEPMJ|nr:predicted protein [Plenodomus lingam JN3]CBX97875.1 predicted protein [Plenodomus lingam JN3]